ncbi:hypothetical protein BJ508DRAFT_117430 [Ascobolus immersus RN42]|uniref:Uncharacterized protein n=1 Tax=Ascobolus immersus RN42 TaxID=1160509 RepID=A0A3N4I671_ASCIM|nr:hypothetical protein BJ508DRAFT_117430 [Ascobolus immersus RN42]
MQMSARGSQSSRPGIYFRKRLAPHSSTATDEFSLSHESSKVLVRTVSAAFLCLLLSTSRIFTGSFFAFSFTQTTSPLWKLEQPHNANPQNLYTKTTHSRIESVPNGRSSENREDEGPHWCMSSSFRFLGRVPSQGGIFDLSIWRRMDQRKRTLDGHAIGSRCLVTKLIS